MKKNNNNAGALQTAFEKATIAVVKYLSENWSLHNQFRHKGELIKEIGLKQNNFSKYEKSQKNIPEVYHPKIRSVLVGKYDVSPMFLDTNKGSMFLKGVMLQEPEAKYYSKGDIEKMEARVKSLTEEMEQLKRENELQKQLIDSYRNIDEKGAKKGAKDIMLQS